MINSGANERSRFCVFAVVFETRVLVVLWLFCPSVLLEIAVLNMTTKNTSTRKTKCETYKTNPTGRVLLLLLLLIDVVE